MFVCLGCDKNLVDSEKMLAGLSKAGYELTGEESEAEIVVINTCCFIHDAKQESIETILRLAELKKSAGLKFLVVMGCLAERYSEGILSEMPEVDAVIGTFACDELVRVLDGLRGKGLQNKAVIGEKGIVPDLPSERLRSDICRYSYLKIAEGCDKRCTYCVIPDIKGHYRSLEFDSLVNEAEELARGGVNELMIIAQETTLYGTDLYGYKRLPELLKRICEIDGIDIVRLMYCYPEEITDELVGLIASEPKIAHYIDMPIQHISDNILRRMGRRTSGADIKAIIKKLRSAVPDIAIRTSLITGFPGETEGDHEELLDFLREYRLDRVGVFTYSKEEGTPAYRMKGQVPARVKQARQKQLMQLQQGIVFEKNRELAGKTMKVVIDGRIPEDDVYVGRTYMDAPDIDGRVFVESDRELISGTVIEAEITSFRDYDLLATDTATGKGRA